MENAFVKTDMEANVVLIEGNHTALFEVKTLEVSNFHENTDAKEQEKPLDWWRNAQT